MNLLTCLREKFRKALEGYVADVPQALDLIKPSQDPKFGDYQANVAMSLSKLLGKKPREIAAEIVGRLDQADGMLEAPEIAGPGFINLRFSRSWLEQQLQTVLADERLGVAKADQAKTFVIDFSGPNVAKPMHVGHLRSTIIGESLGRVLRFLGHKVVGDNHLGDWGAQFGMLIYGYRNYLDRSALEVDPVREMARLYVLVRQKIKEAGGAEEDEVEASNPVAIACRAETAKLHAGDSENVALWHRMMPWCRAELDRVYQRLGVSFDHTLGESYYNPFLAEVVQSLREKGIAEPSQGAVVMFFGENQPPALIQKRDGAFTYMTTDLATIRYRIREWDPDAILYVVDARQALHFQQLFQTAKRAEFGRAELLHVSFGSVCDQDRKPIKTREGVKLRLTEKSLELLLRSKVPAEIVEGLRPVRDQDYTDPDLFWEAISHHLSTEKTASYRSRIRVSALDGAIELDLLLDEAIERAREVVNENSPHLPEAERQIVSEAVGIGAVKYADLSQNRTSDYIFSWEKMLAMNGNTATYLQYAFARCRSIFRKGEIDREDWARLPHALVLNEPDERRLAIQLLRFSEALDATTVDYRPNLVTSYLWDLANAYSSFHQNCAVLKAPTPDVRDSRLALCDLTARTLRLGLGLLGIETIDRM